jgi:Cro/C1-type helix-turn-helix DNA-binding protein
LFVLFAYERSLMGWNPRPEAIYHKALEQGIVPPWPIAIARKTGVPHRTVKRVLAGHTVSTDTMLKLCHGLEATAADLFDPDDDQGPPDAAMLALGRV